MDAIAKRGVVLTPTDLTWDGWIPGMREAGLNYLGLHSSLEGLLSFVQSPKGGAVLEAAERAGIEVDFELHIMSELLPRELFEADPACFRMDENGDRTADANLCVASRAALSIVGENARTHARSLGRFVPMRRYHFWPHDNRPWCHCPSCRELTYSDQYLVFANALCAALREVQPDAQVSYLAYTTTLDAPIGVRPEPGVFLQYAPIYRTYERAMDDPSDYKNRAHVMALQALCKWFRVEEAEALEYWLDVSMFSGWQRPAVRLPFVEENLRRDVAFYLGLGIRRFSAFGVWIDAAYVEAFGEPPLKEYGQALSAAVS